MAHSRSDYHCRFKPVQRSPVNRLTYETYEAAITKLTTGRGHVKNFFSKCARNKAGCQEGGGMGVAGS